MSPVLGTSHFIHISYTTAGIGNEMLKTLFL